MPYFPQLVGGITTQLPSTTGLQFDNFTVDMPAGARYSFSNINSPLGKWTLNFPSISDANMATLAGFFVQQRGRFKPFTLLDPHGNLIPASENFADGSWSNTGFAVGTSATDPHGGSLATSLVAGLGGGTLSAQVLPDGAASGIVVCASVYAKKASTTGTATLGFSDSGAGDQGSKVWAIDTNWRRIFFKLTISTAGVISAYLKTTAPGDVILFGFQVAPLPGPGAYTKTPGNFGLHRKCYFATDAFTLGLKGFGENSLSLPVEETN